MHSRLQSCSLVETASAVPFRQGKIGSLHLGVVCSSSYDWDESSDRDGAADPISVSTSVSQGTYGADDSLEVQGSIRTRVLTISHSESPRLSGSATVPSGLSCFHQAASAPTPALLQGQRLETPDCLLGYATNSQQYAETRCTAVIKTCNELVARQRSERRGDLGHHSVRGRNPPGPGSRTGTFWQCQIGSIAGPLLHFL